MEGSMRVVLEEAATINCYMAKTNLEVLDDNVE